MNKSSSLTAFYPQSEFGFLQLNMYPVVKSVVVLEHHCKRRDYVKCIGLLSFPFDLFLPS